MRARSLRSIVVRLFGAALICSAAPSLEAARAQNGSVRVEVTESGMPIAGATVRAGETTASTDASGVATLTPASGKIQIVAVKDGYEPAATKIEVIAGQPRTVKLELVPKPMSRPAEAIVASTRISRRIEDQATPIEVLGRPALERETLTRPGSIVNALDRLPSLRRQITSPELGTETVRIQGLPGHYGRIVSDGVPLYSDHPGGFALVQIPPMDIGQIEVVTGSASELFGANAVSGAINLLSRRPGAEKEREFLFSQSFQGGTDGMLWLSSPAKGSWSSSYLFGGHYQDEQDVDDDGWSDIAGYSRGTARTRVMWDNRQGKSASGTAGVVFEEREGGSAFAHQNLKTRAADGALFGQMPFGRYILGGGGTLSVQSRTREFGDASEHERREAATIELTLRGTAPRQTWIAGVAADWYALRSSDALASAYSSTRPGIFFHDDVQVAPWLVIAGGARIDHDIKYGYFLSPRGSALVRGGPWSARVSAGRSFYSTLPVTEATEAAGLRHLTIAEPLEMEKARSVTAELAHTTAATSISVTMFDTHIDNPALVDRTTYTFGNDDDPLTSRGVQLLGLVRRGAFSVTGTYAYTDARERNDIQVALTPKHSGSVAASLDGDARGRVTIRVQFTGEQRLDANPYRSTSEPYTTVDLLASRRFGRWLLFANAENLSDVRQTHWDPIARPSRDVDGRWTVDAWAPLAGRLVNVGLKVSF